MKSILDPTFRYTPSVGTDIRKTFARIRREQRLTASGVPAAGEDKGENNISPNVLALPPRRRMPSLGSR